MSSQFQVESRIALGRERWNAFAEYAPEAWLWHGYELQNALLTWSGRTDHGFGVTSPSGELLAVVPIQAVTRHLGPFPVRLLDSLGGWALAPEMTGRLRGRLVNFIVEKITELASAQGALEVRFALSPMAPALRGERCPRVNPLVEAGCSNTLTQTWVVDLRGGTDSLWSALEGRARTAVRKAEKSGVSVRVAEGGADLDTYYRLHRETYARTGARPHPRAYFEAMWRDFLLTGQARCWIAERDGHAVAAESFAVHKKAALYWTGAASPEGLDTGANSLLQWTAMRWMVAEGLEWYETGEAFPGARSGKLKGLSEFKRGFGGQLYPYYKGSLPLAGALSTVYRVLKAVKER